MLRRLLHTLPFLCLFGTLQAQDTATTVAQIIVDSDIHTTLEAAVFAAELDDDLSGPGPFTVFAPTDDAFAVLDTVTLNALLEEPTGDLASILLYHVAIGEFPSTGLMPEMRIEMLDGNSTIIIVADDSIFIDNSLITVTDIVAQNGIVHVIDALLFPPGDADSTLAGIISENDSLSILTNALFETGLDVTLSDDGPLTVFAPTDNAFRALGLDSLSALDNLTDILLYHAAVDSLPAASLSDNLTLNMANGDDALITFRGDSVFINDVQIITTDIVASNGVLHIIDGVLTPPPADTMTMVDTSSVFGIIAGIDSLESLENVLRGAALDSVLATDGPFTVFAPTDEAFNALDSNLLSVLLLDPRGELAEILLYHVATDSLPAAGLTDSMSLAMANGDSTLITFRGDSVFINDAQITVTDLEADNGIVHIIDAVLLPDSEDVDTSTVVDIIINSVIHSTLEEAIIAAELDDDLSGDGPFTVFAPTDSAFAALDTAVLNELLADPTGDLANILQYHVVAGEVSSGDLMDNMRVEMLNGDTTTVSFQGDSIFINDAQIIVADIMAGNGIVHVIDAVLLPTSDTATTDSATVFNLIAGNDSLTTLESVLITTGLNDDLMGDGPFTIFAPSDSAFAALDSMALADIVGDVDGDLTTVLTYHVAPGLFLSTDLMDGMEITTLQGETVTITIENDSAFVNGQLISTADLTASNGVVHIIDGVLLDVLTSTAAEPAFATDVALMPNPASSQMTVELPAEIIGRSTLTIRDLTGRVLSSQTTTQVRESLQLGNLVNGTYLLQIEAQEGIVNRLFVVQR